MYPAGLIESIAECDQCRGREFGDCSDECRFFPLTATPAERERAKQDKIQFEYKPTHRVWTGPRLNALPGPEPAEGAA